MSLDRQEMEAFCDRSYPSLVRALAVFCNDDDLAQELAQEALLRACRRWSHVRTLESPTGWAYHVGANLARTKFRRRQIERRVRRGLQGERPERQDVEGLVSDRLEIREALQELVPAQREVVVLRYLLDLSVEETSQVVGKSPGAVRATAHRAIERLRTQLQVPLAGTETNDVR